MNEKERALLSDDCGRDLASVQALQRKHEGLERELAALDDKVGDLGEEARRLQGRHPDSADRIAAKQAEIVGLWEAIKRKVSHVTQLRIQPIPVLLCTMLYRHHREVQGWRMPNNFKNSLEISGTYVHKGCR